MKKKEERKKEGGVGTKKEKLGSKNISRIWMLGEGARKWENSSQGCQASRRLECPEG